MLQKKFHDFVGDTKASNDKKTKEEKLEFTYGKFAIFYHAKTHEKCKESTPKCMHHSICQFGILYRKTDEIREEANKDNTEK
jgi:hypothetical protein